MDVASFLAKSELSQKEFAKRINRTESYVTKLKKGRVIPSLIQMLVIFMASDGDINICDLIPQSAMEGANLIGADKKPLLKLIMQN